MKIALTPRQEVSGGRLLPEEPPQEDEKPEEAQTEEQEQQRAGSSEEEEEQAPSEASGGGPLPDFRSCNWRGARNEMGMQFCTVCSREVVLADDLATHGRRLVLLALSETYNVALKIINRGGRTYQAHWVRRMKK